MLDVSIAELIAMVPIAGKTGVDPLPRLALARVAAIFVDPLLEPFHIERHVEGHAAGAQAVNVQRAGVGNCLFQGGCDRGHGLPDFAAPVAAVAGVHVTDMFLEERRWVSKDWSSDVSQASSLTSPAATSRSTSRVFCETCGSICGNCEIATVTPLRSV